MIPIQRFHDLAQSLMTVVLLIPHVLVIFHFPLLIEGQGDKAVNRLRVMHESWCVFLFHLECELRIGIGDNFCGESFRRRHDFRYAYMYEVSTAAVSFGER